MANNRLSRHEELRYQYLLGNLEYLNAQQKEEFDYLYQKKLMSMQQPSNYSSSAYNETYDDQYDDYGYYDDYNNDYYDDYEDDFESHQNISDDEKRKTYPRISIASKITESNSLEDVLCVLAHEITHYYQWYFLEEDKRTDRSLEIEANKWSKYVVESYFNNHLSV